MAAHRQRRKTGRPDEPVPIFPREKPICGNETSFAGAHRGHRSGTALPAASAILRDVAPPPRARSGSPRFARDSCGSLDIRYTLEVTWSAGPWVKERRGRYCTPRLGRGPPWTLRQGARGIVKSLCILGQRPPLWQTTAIATHPNRVDRDQGRRRMPNRSAAAPNNPYASNRFSNQNRSRALFGTGLFGRGRSFFIVTWIERCALSV